VLLLSDGANNWGVTGPLQAAEEARRRDIPVDTIALGTESGDILINGVPINTFGMRPDTATLAKIAELSGGHAFTATTGPRLINIYRHLATTVSLSTHEKKQAAALFVAAAAGFVAFGGFLSLLLRPRLP
jgi:Ca-activated chloride channel family protein